MFNKVLAQTNQTVANGASTAPVNFSGAGCVYNWVNNMPSIGLPASGTGNIASFNAINTGNAPVVATITATPLPNGFAYIGNRSNGTVAVINTATNTVVSTITVGAMSSPYGVCVSPDGSRVYIANDTYGTVSVINTANKTVVATITVGSNPIGIAVSPDGSRVYVADGGGTISVINTNTNAVIATINGFSGFYGVCVSPDGKHVYVTNQATSAVSVINSATNAVASTIAVGTQPDGIAVSPDGSRLYVTSVVPNTVSVINTATNAVVSTIAVGTSPVAVSLSPDGSRVYAANSDDGTVSVINTATNSVVKTITVGSAPSGLSVTPDGGEVYAVNETSGNVSVINTATNTVKATVPIPGGSQPFSFGNFVTGGTGTGCATVTFTITVNPTPVTPAITAGKASGNISACAGMVSASPDIQQFTVSGSGLTAGITATAPTGFEVSLAAGSGYGNSITLAQSGGMVGGTVLYVRSAASAPAGNVSGNVLLSSTGATSQNVAVTGTVTANVAPSVGIAASANNICAGTPVTFTAMPSNGGTAPAYQWLVNGNSAGTNNATYTNNKLNNGDIVSCVMTGNGACATSPTATSNSITMVVTADVTPSISIAASANNICAGTPVTFTATPVNGGTAPAYQWMVNGINAGTNSAAYTNSMLNNGDIVSCVMTGNAACSTSPTATSNSITMNVTAQVTPSVSIATPSNNICAGTSVTFTATPMNGGTAPAYQWLLNGNNAGNNNATYTNSTLNNGDMVSCVITGNATCATSPTATSNSIIMTVAANVTPAITITASADNICAGTPVTFTAAPVNGGTEPVYQWMVNGSNAGARNATFATSMLRNGDVVSCTLTSNAACAAPATATSNSITMTVAAQLTLSASITASANNVCAGTPVTFTAAAANGGNAPAYQWLLNGNNVGTNNATYTNSTLANGDVVSCVVTGNATCATSPTATSNSIAMHIISQGTLSVRITASADSICAGTQVTFTATPKNGGATPAYQWMVNGNNAGINSPIYTSSTLANGDVVSCLITGNAACVAPGTAPSNNVTMSVTEQVTPSVSIAASADSICAGIPITFTATPTNGGNTPAYEWLVNNTAAGSGSTFTSNGLNNGDSVYCIVTGSLACSVPDSSAAVYMVLYPLPVITFNPDTIFLTGNNGVQLDPAITGNIAQYQWSPPGGLNPSDSVVSPVASPVQTTTYQLFVATDKGCTATGRITVIAGLPLLMPGAFTPNGDGHNDVFRIPPGVQFTLQEFDVFDRWGNRVFVSKNISQGWDGTINGVAATPGAYIYMIRGTDKTGGPVLVKGTVVLIR